MKKFIINIRMLSPFYMRFYIFFLLYISFIFTASPLMFCLSFIMLGNIIGECVTYFLMPQRINHFFVYRRFAFSKWKTIYQSTQNKYLKHADCNDLYRLLPKKICGMFWDGLSKGYYQTISHAAIIRRIRYMQKIGALKIIEEVPLETKSLGLIQKQLLHNKCKHCKDTKGCPYFLHSQELTRFYFVRFKVFYNFKGLNGRIRLS